MGSELTDFEHNMQREINDFLSPEKRSRPSPPRPAAKVGSKPQSAKAYKTGHLIKLAVRKKQLELDSVFEHRSSSISKLEAQLEAEKAAKQAGYPIIGYVIDIQRL